MDAAELRDLRFAERMTEAEHATRMAAARARSQWELGDPSWAHVILDAYMDPDGDRQRLEMEQ